jgi:23S rRNA (cytosine1962-C5)-methyltransferase
MPSPPTSTRPCGRRLAFVLACVPFLLQTHSSTSIAPWERRRVAVQITRGCEQRLRRLAESGAQFAGTSVFQEEVLKVSYDAEPGTVAAAFGPTGKAAVAVGLYDPDSPIRLRLVSHGARQTPLDGAWLRGAVATAVAERTALFSGAETTGYRLVNGENDGLPGLVVDRYGGTLVAKAYAGSWLPWACEVAAALEEACSASFAVERVVLLLSRELSKMPKAERLGLTHGDVLLGAPLARGGEVEFVENGISFGCDPVNGQKTGFFLDQRDNRARVATLVAAQPGCRVLNVFSYTGGFSLYAADGGAREVTSVDLSRAAIDAVDANFARNAQRRPRIGAARHEGLAGDAFELMEGLRRDGRQFELVIVDPPAFAQRERHVEAALVAYAKLARAAVQLTAPGGTVLLASCSSRVSADEFHATVEAAARQLGRPLDVFERTAHACDHPVRASGCTPYLKATFARV